MYQVVYALQVIVVINIEQSLKTTLALVADLGCCSITLSIKYFLAYNSRSKLAIGQPDS